MRHGDAHLRVDDRMAEVRAVGKAHSAGTSRRRRTTNSSAAATAAAATPARTPRRRRVGDDEVIGPMCSSDSQLEMPGWRSSTAG
jgi:hypothetical protein